MKDKLPLIIAVIFGAIAFFGINKYLKSQEKVTPTTQILVAKDSMEKGQRITANDVAAITVEQKLVSGLSGFFTPNQRNLLIDQVVGKNMKPREPIMESSLALPDEGPQYERFSMKLSPGERAISLPIDNAGAVSSFIRVDDRVDILANIQVPETTTKTFTIPNQGVQEISETAYEPTTLFLFENVRIMAVGNMYEEPEPGQRLSASGGTVTIAVTPREGQILAWAMRNSGGAGGSGGVSFTMLLRSPQDKGMVYPRELVTYENLLDLTKIQELQQLRLQQEESQRTEIYQGGVPVKQQNSK